MSSQYQPQPPHWQYDLYKMEYFNNGIPCSSNKHLLFVNDDYCEFARMHRGMENGYRQFSIGFMALSFIFSITVCVMVLVLVNGQSNKALNHLLLPIVIELFCIIICYFTSKQLYAFIKVPRTLPIRFNRKTGKVSLLENPLLTGFRYSDYFRYWPWQMGLIMPREYDWSDIQGIVTGATGATGSGAISVSATNMLVCEPGINKVKEILYLASGSTAELCEWLWINNYMAFKDEWLDKQTFTPGVEWAKPAVWPEDLDKKSKASSIEEYEQIVAEFEGAKQITNKL